MVSNALFFFFFLPCVCCPTISLCLFMSLPASITGAHAKKQGEDLSDNDGDEDEGIFYGEQRWCMSFSFFSFFFSFCFTIFIS